MPEYAIDFGELKERVSIHQAMQYLQLAMVQKGGSYRGKCPACKGSDNALVVTPAKAVYYCWNEKSGGDAIKLVAHVKGIKNYDAAKLLHEYFGPAVVPATAGQSQPQQPEQRPQPRQKVVTYDPDRYFTRLSQDHEALAPLGVSPETLRALKAGYATGGRHPNRLALPVADRAGTIVGHFGVSLDGTNPRIKLPTDNFEPDAYLFNWERVQDGEEFVYLTLDVLAAVKAIDSGVENVVAPLGVLNSETIQTLSNWMAEKKIGAIEPM